MTDFYSKSLKNIPNNFDKVRSEAKERRRTVLYLILAYLEEQGLRNTAENLRAEALLDAAAYQTCENVDLDLILREYQSYHYVKYQKYPKILRKTGERSACAIKTKSTDVKNKTPDNQNGVKPPCEAEPSFHFDILSYENSQNDQKPRNCTETDYGDLTKQILDDIVPHDAGIGWQHCVGLSTAVEILKESCIYPQQYPELFVDLAPWKGVLLYGPPGTGKTLLAKSLACEAKTTFFNVTCSTFVSKWRGESEKLLKTLFDTATSNTPCIVFLDEVDSLVCNNGTVHEASRRFRSELLVRIDGIVSAEPNVFVLASTNSPWLLDSAVLRRFDKRVLVDLPDKMARIEIFRWYLKNRAHNLTDCDFEAIGEETRHFSGSDIKTLVKEIVMESVRSRIGDKQRKNGAPEKMTYRSVQMALEKVKPCANDKLCARYRKWAEQFGAL
ncbi:katanin p60 ATPase-containing subunit A-like 2 [Cylas formicarius]|uniref:katanin p60 ATPase-containing subunit A-like 2 n=1 Tax=Cylas formicarius TaxID=197179 RepID=UPI002958D53D|nr:katanin p60 ATPase-containing subunit A-like 2 [Cylas formicarius]